jgi:hypothetical protein
LPTKGGKLLLGVKGAAVAGSPKFTISLKTFTKGAFAPRDKIQLGEKTLSYLRKSSNVCLKRGRWRWTTRGECSLAWVTIKTDMDLSR